MDVVKLQFQQELWRCKRAQAKSFEDLRACISKRLPDSVNIDDVVFVFSCSKLGEFKVACPTSFDEFFEMVDRNELKCVKLKLEIQPPAKDGEPATESTCGRLLSDAIEYAAEVKYSAEDLSKLEPVIVEVPLLKSGDDGISKSESSEVDKSQFYIVCSACDSEIPEYPFFVCMCCSDYFLCLSCETTNPPMGSHDGSHPLIKVSSKEQLERCHTPELRKPKVPSRSYSTSSTSSSGSYSFHKFQSQFVCFACEGIKPGTMVEYGCQFKAGWVIRNNGSVSWPTDGDIQMVQVSGDDLLVLLEPIKVKPLSPGEELEVCGEFLTPEGCGPARLVQSFWRLQYKGKLFGQRFKLEVDLVSPGLCDMEKKVRKIEVMGFDNRELIVDALNMCCGDVEQAVHQLIKWKVKPCCPRARKMKAALGAVVVGSAAVAAGCAAAFMSKAKR